MSCITKCQNFPNYCPACFRNSNADYNLRDYFEPKSSNSQEEKGKP